MLVKFDSHPLVRYNNANYFYQKNHQGSVTEITAANQSTVKSYKYDAFGDILQETGPSVPGGLTYTSRPYHSRSDLYYYRARWYDPELGRFLTPDPIGHLGGVNLYAYVGNDPVNLIDPLGLCGESFGESFTDWLMNDFVVPGPYGSTDPNEWGYWTSLPYEAGKFGKKWEYAEWGACGIAAAATTVAGGAAAVQTFATTTVIEPRVALGVDGSSSWMVKTVSRISGKTIRVVHEVIKEGEVIHRHVKFVSGRFWPW